MENTDIHRTMGARFNMKTWKLLEKPHRTEAETSEMIHCVHASLAHWLIAGGHVEEVRGLWHIARVYAEIGDAEQADRYSLECKNLAQQVSSDLKDFDRVYVLEAEARANAIAGNLETARDLKQRALTMAEDIKGERDREVVLADLSAGNWGNLVA